MGDKTTLQPGDQVADTDGMAAERQRLAAEQLHGAVDPASELGRRVDAVYLSTRSAPAELRPPPHAGLGQSLLGGPRASEAQAWNLGQGAASALRARIAELEAEVAILRGVEQEYIGYQREHARMVAERRNQRLSAPTDIPSPPKPKPIPPGALRHGSPR